MHCQRTCCHRHCFPLCNQRSQFCGLLVTCRWVPGCKHYSHTVAKSHPEIACTFVRILHTAHSDQKVSFVFSCVWGANQPINRLSKGSITQLDLFRCWNAQLNCMSYLYCPGLCSRLLVCVQDQPPLNTAGQQQQQHCSLSYWNTVHNVTACTQARAHLSERYLLRPPEYMSWCLRLLLPGSSAAPCPRFHPTLALQNSRCVKAAWPRQSKSLRMHQYHC